MREREKAEVLSRFCYFLRLLKCAEFREPQLPISTRTGLSVAPRAVSEYSTFGGT